MTDDEWEAPNEHFETQWPLEAVDQVALLRDFLKDGATGRPR